MKNVSKVILSLCLIIVFLVSCIFLISTYAVGAWLHTYNAFTSKTLVARVTISEQKTDDLGEYADVQFTPIKNQSALTKLISGDSDTVEEVGETQTFKLYGDTIHIGGPVVKMRDELALVNFKTIFKVGKIFARYNVDNEAEKNRTEEMQSTYDLNGGIDSNWVMLDEDLNKDNLKGKILRQFVDATQVDVPGKFVNNKETKYKLYMTEEGFIWEVDR